MLNDDPDDPAKYFRMGRWCLAINFYQQWKELFGKNCNWYNFSFINFSVEWATSDSNYKGRFIEFTIGLLGFNLIAEIYDTVDRDGEMTKLSRLIQNYDRNKEGYNTYDV